MRKDDVGDIFWSSEKGNIKADFVRKPVVKANLTNYKPKLKDLCQEDKVRIANLIKELARVGDEKDKVAKRLQIEHEAYRKFKEKSLREQRGILKQNQGAQTQLLECQRLLSVYQTQLLHLQEQLTSLTLASDEKNIEEPHARRRTQSNISSFSREPHKSPIRSVSTQTIVNRDLEQQQPIRSLKSDTVSSEIFAQQPTDSATQAESKRRRSHSLSKGHRRRTKSDLAGPNGFGGFAKGVRLSNGTVVSRGEASPLARQKLSDGIAQKAEPVNNFSTRPEAKAEANPRPHMPVYIDHDTASSRSSSVSSRNNHHLNSSVQSLDHVCPDSPKQQSSADAVNFYLDNNSDKPYTPKFLSDPLQTESESHDDAHNARFFRAKLASMDEISGVVEQQHSSNLAQLVADMDRTLQSGSYNSMTKQLNDLERVLQHYSAIAQFSLGQRRPVNSSEPATSYVLPSTIDGRVSALERLHSTAMMDRRLSHPAPQFLSQQVSYAAPQYFLPDASIRSLPSTNYPPESMYDLKANHSSIGYSVEPSDGTNRRASQSNAPLAHSRANESSADSHRTESPPTASISLKLDDQSDSRQVGTLSVDGVTVSGGVVEERANARAGSEGLVLSEVMSFGYYDTDQNASGSFDVSTARDNQKGLTSVDGVSPIPVSPGTRRRHLLEKRESLASERSRLEATLVRQEAELASKRRHLARQQRRKSQTKDNRSISTSNTKSSQISTQTTVYNSSLQESVNSGRSLPQSASVLSTLPYLQHMRTPSRAVYTPTSARSVVTPINSSYITPKRQSPASIPFYPPTDLNLSRHSAIDQSAMRYEHERSSLEESRLLHDVFFIEGL